MPSINILCIGDVVGRAGRDIVANHLPGLIEERQIEFVVCNAENIAGGSGIIPGLFDKVIKSGVDVVTLGDHCYRKSDIYPVLNDNERLIRPGNFPRNSTGRWWTVLPSKSGKYQIGVTCAIGQMYMANSNSPWASVDEALAKISEQTCISVVDFHAEASSEKIGMGWYCNGKTSIVFGTHTHTPTADGCVLDGGTAFISDVGMTGPYNSILGRNKERVLKFMTTAMPQRFDVASGDERMYALLVEVQSETGKARSAELLCVKDK